MTTIPSVLPFHTIVSIAGIVDDDFTATFNLNANIAASGSVEGAQGSEGSAVTLDTSSANTVKLGGDGDRIIGRLETTEKRPAGNVGGVSLQGVLKFPIDASVTINVGDTLVCSGSATGAVRARASASDWSENMVVEVNTTTTTTFPHGYAVAYFR